MLNIAFSLLRIGKPDKKVKIDSRKKPAGNSGTPVVSKGEFIESRQKSQDWRLKK